jgi:hypothetical protein
VRAGAQSCSQRRLAHNHPSGISLAVACRSRLTQTLKALVLVDVRVLDHFVVTSTEAVSMASRNGDCFMHQHSCQRTSKTAPFHERAVVPGKLLIREQSQGRSRQTDKAAAPRQAEDPLLATQAVKLESNCAPDWRRTGSGRACRRRQGPS